MTAVTAVIALDFDGVINTEDTYRRADLDALIHTASEEHSARLIERDLVARVQRVCDATGAGVVVVSAWRAFFSLDALTRLLRGAGLTAPVLGAVGHSFGADRRAHHFEEWLGAHPEVTRWCVIDDSEEHWGSLHTTLTHFETIKRASGVVERTPVYDLERRAHPRFAGRCVHPDDGITEADADAAIAILRGAP